MSFGRRLFACCSGNIHGLIFLNGFALLCIPFISSAMRERLFAGLVCIDLWPILLVHSLDPVLPWDFGVGAAICIFILGWFVADCCLAATIQAVVVSRGSAPHA